MTPSSACNFGRSSLICLKQITICLCLSLRLAAQDEPQKQLDSLTVYLKRGQYEEAEKIAKALIARPDEDKLDNIKGVAHRALARINASHSQKGAEIEELFRSYGYFSEANNPREEAEALTMIGSFYLHMYQFPKAAKYLNEAKQKGKPLNDTLLFVHLLNNSAQLAWHSYKVDSSILLFEQAIVLASKKNLRSTLPVLWDHLAYSYQQKDEKKMLVCLREALRFVTKQTQADSVGIIYSDLGWAFLLNNKLDSAEWALQKSMNLIKQGGNREQEMILYQHLSNLRLKQGRHNEAILFLRQHNLMQRELFDAQLLDAISYADAKFKEHTANIRLLEAEARDRLFVIGFVSFAVLVIGLIFVVLWLRRSNRIIRMHEKDLKTALVKFEQSEKDYRQLFENSLALIITHTLDGRFINVNHATEQTLKMPNELLAGSSIGDYLHPDYKNLFPEYLHDINEKNESEGWLRVVDADGVSHTLRYQNRVVASQNGSGSFVISFAQDQTEIFQTRAALDLEHKRMMTVMENSPDIFSVLTKDATITYINRATFPGANEAFGKNMLNYRETDQASIFYRHLINVFNTNTTVELQESLKDKHYLTKLVPIKIDDQVKEVLSINIDITSQKQSEIELKHAKEEAEESNRLKTIFLGSLSHEVRTPLQGIMGMAELLELPTTSEEKRREFIQIIKRRTNDMQNIIESLLDMASLETGEIKSFPQRVNLREAIDTVYQRKLYDQLLATKPIQLKLELDIEKNAFVFVDPQHLQQVFTNLIRNSIKFTNEGCITITADEDENSYRVMVKDTGIGIAPEKVDQIFKPFRQAHEGLSRSKGGIGLGLSICKKMVEMWNGRIYVESKIGEGSTFSVTLPKVNGNDKAFSVS